MLNGTKSLKDYNYGKKLRLSFVAIILGILVLAPMVAAAENPNPGVVPPDSIFNGKSYGEWSAAWWQWIFSIPKDSNPLYDDGTGKFTTAAQSGDVWFLAGSWNNPPTTEIHLNVPEGKAIFLPIINAESSKIEGYGANEAELRSDVEKTIGWVNVKKAIVDGNNLQNLDNYLVESDLFTFWLPPDVKGEPNNALGISTGNKGSESIAVAAGYWIMLKPLSPGEHTIYIYGMAVLPPKPNPTDKPSPSKFVTEMTYKINVIPKNK